MLEALSRSLREDPDLFVRYEALVSLAEVGHKRVGDLLRQALDDPDGLISATAAELISMQGNSGREQ
jgi:HEAT repeat protein